MVQFNECSKHTCSSQQKKAVKATKTKENLENLKLSFASTAGPMEAMLTLEQSVTRNLFQRARRLYRKVFWLEE